MKTDLQFIVLLGGKSSRNYPHSKGLPHKALLPLGDFKVINYIISNIYNAGGRIITFVIANDSYKKHFENCFVQEPKIEEKFRKKNNLQKVNLLKKTYLPNDLKINFIVQKTPLGIGHAVAISAEQNKNVYVVFPDDIILSEKTHPFTRAVEEYEKTKSGNIVITREVEDPSRWGIIEKGIYVEKPKTSTSNEAVISSLILDKSVVEIYKKQAKRLEKTENRHDILNQVDAINQTAKQNPKMKIRTVPCLSSDTYLDCGTIEGYEKALIYTLLKDSVFSQNNKELMNNFF
ncbi:MAG: sugar phosphate nucleotidyltransferase [Alphaproteobacteria bacterium]|nr:MAG: hypothetical protein B6I23_00395 [Rickettsiaceae bacterium 4572_127]